MKIVEARFLREIINICLSDGMYQGIQITLKKLDREIAADRRVSDGKVFLTLSEAQQVAEVFKRYGLSRSADILLEWVGRDIRSSGLTPEVVMSDLQRSVERELRTTIFLYVEEGRREYFEGKHLFGESVSAAFPSTTDDIEEAGKCMALGRYTACAFHLMRVLEAGLRALGKSLNDDSLDPKRNPTWDRILKRCDKEIEKSPVDRSLGWREDQEFFSGVTATLRAVKDAWRNPVMHVEKKYSEEDTEEIFIAARAFMRHLAGKLAE